MILFLLYVENLELFVLVRRSSSLIRLLLERGAHWGYFTEPDKSLFIAYAPAQEAAVQRKFEV